MPDQDVPAYPCRTSEKATALAARFIAGVTKPGREDRAGNPLRAAQPAAAPVPE